MMSVSSYQAVVLKCKMRILIVSALFACAAAAPGVLAPYEAQVAAHQLTPAEPTISAGDINGAAIDAQVEAADHVRAVVDAERQVADKVSELHGQAINNAEEQAWRHVDRVKTVEAQLDGAAARAAPTIAKNIVRGSLPAPIAPVPRVAPAAPVAPAGPVAPVAPAAPVAPDAATYASSDAPVAVPYPGSLPAGYIDPVSGVPYSDPYANYAAPIEYSPYSAYSDPLFDNYGFAPLDYTF